MIIGQGKQVIVALLRAARKFYISLILSIDGLGGMFWKAVNNFGISFILVCKIKLLVFMNSVVFT